jgi:hypothetical protein
MKESNTRIGRHSVGVRARRRASASQAPSALIRSFVDDLISTTSQEKSHGRINQTGSR